MGIQFEPLGDRALLARDLPAPAWAWAEWLNARQVPGLVEAFASYETVGLEIDPEVFRLEDLPSFEPGEEIESREHEIPVCYALGEDLSSVAERLGLTEQEVVRLHSASVYRCEAVGFCPGFPYLSGLDPRLHGIPRRPSPRTHTEPGSVAITGAQCGIYPLVRPGGWAILGRTPLVIVDPNDGYFPIRAGDQIRFVPIDVPDYERLEGRRL